MTNIILSGSNGIMGRVIARLVSEMDDAIICAGFDIDKTSLDGFKVYDEPADFTGDADVIIDFSHPAALKKLVDYATSRKIPMVVATTGLSKEQVSYLKESSSKIPIFFSANMSIGVNLLIDLVRRASALLYEEFDVEIIEKHHNQKIDAPSGTALSIADAICDSIPETREYVYDRHSVRRKRGKQEIGIHAVRGGTIVGDHSVIFAGKDEIIELKHTAMSKEIFAVGAVRAAKFIKTQTPGMYDMNDLISNA